MTKRELINSVSGHIAEAYNTVRGAELGQPPSSWTDTRERLDIALRRLNSEYFKMLGADRRDRS